LLLLLLSLWSFPYHHYKDEKKAHKWIKDEQEFVLSSNASDWRKVVSCRDWRVKMNGKFMNYLQQSEMRKS